MYSRHGIIHSSKALRTSLKSSAISPPGHHHHLHHPCTQSVSSDPVTLVPLSHIWGLYSGAGLGILCSEPTKLDTLHGQPSDKSTALKHSQDAGHDSLLLISFPGRGRKLFSLLPFRLFCYPNPLGHLQSLSK